MSEKRNVQWNDTPAMRSPLAWALLGLVIEQPSYGYELLQRFRRAYGETLALGSPKHIYRLLDLLAAHGLIEEMEPNPDEKPARNRLPKPRYRATQQGSHAYAESLLMQMEEERHRQRLFARQLAMLEPHAALSVIDRYEEECLTEADESSAPESERESVALKLTAQEEQLALAARLSWVEFARRELSDIIEQEGPDTRKRKSGG
jgi:DNA-binding PadR family transcriptional regulator